VWWATISHRCTRVSVAPRRLTKVLDPSIISDNSINNSNANFEKIVEAISGNGTATSTELNAIRGVSGAFEGIDYSTALESGTYADSETPTIEEIQAVINAENISNANLLKATEDIAGNADNRAATAAELNAIRGVSGAVEKTDYLVSLVNGTYEDPSNPTSEEIQAVIDARNAEVYAENVEMDARNSMIGSSNAGYEEVVEDIIGNANRTPVTAEQINSIAGVSRAVEGIDYSEALQAGSYVDNESPTLEEIQAVIDAKNISNSNLVKVIEDIEGNTDNREATAAELNAIKGVSGALEGISYIEALQNGDYADASNPTITELQSIIDAKNISNSNFIKVIEDIAGNADNIRVLPEELNNIKGVSGAIKGTDYTEALINGTYEDPSNPTVTEIQMVIDSRNDEVVRENNKVSELPPIVHSIGGEEKNSEDVVHERVEVSVPVTKGIDENSLRLEGEDENGEVVVKNEGTWRVEDGKIVFTPKDGFVYDPTPIKYSMSNEDGTQLAAQIVEVNYPGLLRSDVKLISNFKEPVVLNVLNNDNGDLDVSTLKIRMPKGFKDEHPDAVLASDGKTLTVPNEGTWSVLKDGTISYEPLTDVEPTPIQYEVYDNALHRVLSLATINIKKTAVAGVSMEAEESKTSHSVPTLSKLGMGLTALLVSLFGLFLFRKEKKS